jgi:hypothetical protein
VFSCFRVEIDAGGKNCEKRGGGGEKVKNSGEKVKNGGEKNNSSLLPEDYPSDISLFPSLVVTFLHSDVNWCLLELCISFSPLLASSFLVLLAFSSHDHAHIQPIFGAFSTPSIMGVNAAALSMDSAGPGL